MRAGSSPAFGILKNHKDGFRFKPKNYFCYKKSPQGESFNLRADCFDGRNAQWRASGGQDFAYLLGKGKSPLVSDCQQLRQYFSSPRLGIRITEGTAYRRRSKVRFKRPNRFKKISLVAEVIIRANNIKNRIFLR